MNDKKASVQNRTSPDEPRVRGRGRRTFWVMVFIGAAVAMVSYMMGCVDQHRHHRGLFSAHSARPDWLLTQIETTDEQRQKMGTILTDFEAAAHTWRQEHEALRERFMQALQADQVSAGDLGAIKSTGMRLTDKALSRTVDAALQVSQTLTPEQRRELVAKWSRVQ